MYTAVEEGHFEICQLLIEYNADVNMCPHGEWAKELIINQQSPLLLACIKNNSQVNVRIKNEKYFSYLYSLAFNISIKIFLDSRITFG